MDAENYLTPDEYISYCKKLIATADKYGHPHHEFERTLDELIELVLSRAKS